jgi:N-hydroxyarylamine O-acetyltransferase
LTLAGLAALYRAWCASVPFENTRKMMALRTGGDGELPGARAADFLAHLIDHGTGGTCWPSSNALYAVASALGFDARRVAGSMRDLGVVSHASVKVRIDGADWLVDSSMLTNEPTPLGPGVFVGGDPVWPVEVEAVDGTHLIWWHTPPSADYVPCRLLVDPAPFEVYLEGYERSRGRSPFNQRLYARRNRPATLVILLGNTRISRTAAGVASRDLTPDELRAALRDDIGLSVSHVEAWEATGSLDASFEPATGAPPAAPAPKPPSMRQSDRGAAP